MLEDGSEYDISDAEIVLIDGEDSAPTSVGEKDTVVVVYETSSGNADKALAVYVVEEYDEDNTGATMKPNATLVSQSTDDDHDVRFDIFAGANVDAVLDEFVFSYKATYSFVTEDEGDEEIKGFTAGNVWLKVVSESTNETTWHKCRVVVAPVNKDMTAEKLNALLNVMDEVTVTGAVPSGVTVEDGKTLTIGKDATGTPSLTVANGGKVVVAADSTLSAGASITVENGGELVANIADTDVELRDIISTGDFTIAMNAAGGFDITINGAVTIASELAIWSKDTLTLGAGAVVTVTKDVDIVGRAGTITAEDGAQIIVSGDSVSLSHGDLTSINAAGTWTYNTSSWSNG